MVHLTLPPDEAMEAYLSLMPEPAVSAERNDFRSHAFSPTVHCMREGQCQAPGITLCVPLTVKSFFPSFSSYFIFFFQNKHPK